MEFPLTDPKAGDKKTDSFLEATITKPERFRKAVLGLTVIDKVVPMLTIDDVVRRWSFLAGGHSPCELVQIGNADDIDDELFKTLMKRLNSAL